MHDSAAALVLANARLVLADEVVTGSVALRGGVITDVDSGARVPAGALDCEGALVTPGLIELHTDNLERHLKPRPGVRWPGPEAVVAHDGEVALAGITTVFDAIRVGSLKGRGESVQYLRYARDAADAVKRLKDRDVLRVDHRLHLRSEVCSETVLEELDEFRGEALVGIVSIMDHTPGQRQFADMARHREFYRIRHAMSDYELESYVAHTQGLHARHGAEHEQGIVELARGLGAVLASHDDTTVEHVARSVELGIGFAEFPTTLEAARACRAAGVPVMMGEPNILQGGSHTGNVAAMDLAEQGLLDILSSDYAPSALLMGR